MKEWMNKPREFFIGIGIIETNYTTLAILISSIIALALITNMLLSWNH